MKTMGMSLVELLVGLVVASIVAAIAMTNLSMVGLAVMRQRVAVRSDDAVWLAQTAIARDLRDSDGWKGCVEGAACAVRSSHAHTPVLLLDAAHWLVDDGLRRCKEKLCDSYVEGMAGIEFIAGLHDHGGIIRRKALAEAHDNAAVTLEVVLWTMDGRRHSRSTARPAHAQ